MRVEAGNSNLIPRGLGSCIRKIGSYEMIQIVRVIDLTEFHKGLRMIVINHKFKFSIQVIFGYFIIKVTLNGNLQSRCKVQFLPLE